MSAAAIFAAKVKPPLKRRSKHIRSHSGMFSGADKERKRSYLLPGMGSRAYRRKRNVILTCSALIGLGVSLVLAALLYWINHLVL